MTDTHRLNVSDGRNPRTEHRPYSDDPDRGYDVEYMTFDITIGGVTKAIEVSRLAGEQDGYHHNFLSSGRPVTVRVGRGTKTYAVNLCLLDVSHRDGPGALALANFAALNRQAYAIGWTEDMDETNIRSGYGA